MATQVLKKTVSLELVDGIVIEVDLKPIYSTVVVQPPPPKKVARVLVNLGDHNGAWDAMTLGLDIEVAVKHKRKPRKTPGPVPKQLVAPKEKPAPRSGPGRRSTVKDARDRFANIEVD
ncbi:MAG: hypothetical protein J7507_07800 [Pseudoxanthomonas sp.]|nr:hypothetical protein [Pseudoxanthomonas sp.]